MGKTNKPYGVYVGGQCVISYDTDAEAQYAANFATKETGAKHTVGPAPQAPSDEPAN